MYHTFTHNYPSGFFFTTKLVVNFRGSCLSFKKKLKGMYSAGLKDSSWYMFANRVWIDHKKSEINYLQGIYELLKLIMDLVIYGYTLQYRTLLYNHPG